MAPALPTKTDHFSNFIRLTREQRLQRLRFAGILLDTDIENDEQTNLYLLDGFFVEEIISVKNSAPALLLPYKRGFSTRKASTQNTGFDLNLICPN